jgi:RNA polymerase sigma factor (sigma-70 family)
LKVHTSCSASAEDIASETFMQLLNKPVLPSIQEPKAFLTTVAKRLMFQGWRRRDLERAYLESLAGADELAQISIEDRAELLETLMSIDQLLSGLPAKVKATFLLSQIDGLTYPQIARELGISESSVSQYMGKAFKRCLRVAVR